MDETNKPQMSLEDYIKENQLALSTLGVFVALITFAQDLYKPFNFVLSFLLIAAFLLVGYGLWQKLPREKSPRLFLFSYVMSVGGITIVAYWLYEFRLFWDFFLWLPAWFIVFGFLLYYGVLMVRSSKPLHKIFGGGDTLKKWYHTVARVVSIGIALWVSFAIGVSLATLINISMDFIQRVTNK